MEIAIIGVGNVGSTLARACVAAGHEIVLSARHAEPAAKVARMSAAEPPRPTSTERRLREGLSASDSLADAIQLLAPEASVVKVCNTIFASRISDPVVDDVPLDGFYAGDGEATKSMVVELLVAIGFRPLDVGGLLAARVLELMALVHICLNARRAGRGSQPGGCSARLPEDPGRAGGWWRPAVALLCPAATGREGR
jgi:hypothetical protein